MTAEEAANISEGLDALEDDVRNDRATVVAVRSAAVRVVDQLTSSEVFTRWHLHQIQSLLIGLRWNEFGRRAARTSVGLSIAISALRLLIIPMERVDEELREPADGVALHAALTALSGDGH